MNQSIEIVFPIKRIQSNRSDSSVPGIEGGGVLPKKVMGVLIRYFKVKH